VRLCLLNIQYPTYYIVPVRQYIMVHRLNCAQVYRLEYPGEIASLFRLQLEDGLFADIPDFYLYSLEDVNGRTTFDIVGMFVSFVSRLITFINYSLNNHNNILYYRRFDFTSEVFIRTDFR